MDNARIKRIVEEFDLSGFRARQLRQAFFVQHRRDYREITTLSKDLRDRLAAEIPAMTVTLDRMQVSERDPVRKALLRLADGECIETVLMGGDEDRWTCCVSSQVGCHFDCRFCATGRLGFTRHLSAEEISDQVLFWRQHLDAESLPGRLTNVVYMGMGEPLENRRAVFASIDELTDSDTFDIGARRISVSTVGICAGIEALAERHPQVNLAVSLHAANDGLRDRLVPHNRRENLAMIREAVEEYIADTNRKVFLEWALLDGVNDDAAAAAELADYVHSFDQDYLVHVNLIGGNPVPGAPRGAGTRTTHAFRVQLEGRGVAVTVRRSLGADIDAACGQLAARGVVDTPAAKKGNSPS